MQGVLLETERMLQRGRMDLPLSLCFAAVRGDELLLQQLLRRGLDPNESDDSGRTALHIAASKGSKNCCLLLIDHGADPNSRDVEGNVPLWEAILNRHESVSNLLKENGANLLLGDLGQFACTASEQNSLDLLNEIVRYGGDVTVARSNGTTALHVAVSEGNTEIVKFLLDHGANMDNPDANGWTPRQLADQQGHEEITALFQAKKDGKFIPDININVPATRFLGKFKSEPSIRPLSPENHTLLNGTPLMEKRSRSRTDNFNNSLFGIMSGSHVGERGAVTFEGPPKYVGTSANYPVRVTIACPEKGDAARKLIILPHSIQELLVIGGKKFGFSPTKVLSKDGVEIEAIELIRDEDHLLLVSGGGIE